MKRIINTVVIAISITKDFFAFLIEQNALIRYLDEHHAQEPEETFDHLFHENDPSGWVSGAFIWSETKEGHYFWSDLHEKWNALLDKEAEGAGKVEYQVEE